MKAVYYEQFGGPVEVRDVPEPATPDHGVVIRVEATGLCRSDWHGWMGHDADISLPHVPGHELAGVIESVGKGVGNWHPGDRVTLPFVCGCGSCEQCHSGNHQVCDRQFQPGFTHWGSFAEYVAVHYADENLVRLPDELDFVTAASLGCRFSTAWRAIVDQGEVSEGQWVAVHGCGGVGLSAVNIASGHGARVIAIDISRDALDLAIELGATAVIDASDFSGTAEQIRELSQGGAHLSVDALGHRQTLYNSISCLRKRGRHVQVGLLSPGDRDAPVPTGIIVANELRILGSHGLQASRYPDMLGMIMSGRLNPGLMISQCIGLESVPRRLARMDRFDHHGITVVDRF